ARGRAVPFVSGRCIVELFHDLCAQDIGSEEVAADLGEIAVVALAHVIVVGARKNPTMIEDATPRLARRLMADRQSIERVLVAARVIAMTLALGLDLATRG